MKRWEQLPDVPGWTVDLRLPTFAVYRRVFDEAVVLVSLSLERDIVRFGPDYWTVDGVLSGSRQRMLSHSFSCRGECPFAWAEERFGRKAGS